jgi:hypothetical protein
MSLNFYDSLIPTSPQETLTDYFIKTFQQEVGLIVKIILPTRRLRNAG